MGIDFLGRTVVVVFTYRGDDIRMISARPATKSERNVYLINDALREYTKFKDSDLEKTVRKVIREELKILAKSLMLE
jgi:hypothetical protein